MRVKDKEIKLSLRTTSLVHAKQKVREIIEHMARNRKMYTPDNLISTIDEVLGEYINEAVREYSELENKRFASIGRFDEATYEQKIEEYSNAIFDASKADDLKEFAGEVVNRSTAKVQELAKQISMPSEQRVFFEKLLKAEEYVLKIDIERYKGLKTGNSNPYDPSSRLWGSPNVTRKTPAPINGNFLGTTAENNQTTYTCTDLKEPFERFMKEKESLNKHGETEYKAMIRIISTFMDETGFEIPFNKEAVRQLEDVLSYYPKNITKYPKFQNKTLEQIVSMVKNAKKGEVDLLSFETQNKRRQQINSILAWLEEKYDMSKNKKLAKLKQTKQSKKTTNKDKKDPFNGEELTIIFEALAKERARYPERFWLSLIHFFAGVRTEEAAQLRISDIRQDKKSGIWYFHIIDEEPWQSLKSLARDIPIHSKLIELGLLDYLKQRKKDLKNDRNLLLPVYNKSGTLSPLLSLEKKPDKPFHDGVSDWFNEDFLPKLGIKTNKKSIYSFRHSFRDSLKKNSTREIATELMGHTHDNLTDNWYGGKTSLKILQEHIEKMELEDFDIKNLLLATNK